MSIYRHMWIIIPGILLCASLPAMAQKLDLEWVTPVSGAGGSINTTSIALDKEEHVYAVGVFKDSIEVPTKNGIQKIKAVSNNTNSLFILKTDPTGIIEWIKGIGGTMAMGAAGNDDWFSVVLDQNNNIYISGCYRGTVDFDPGPNQVLKTAKGQYANEANTFILKLNEDGQFVWVRTFHGALNTSNDMAIDEKSGTVCLTGFLEGKVEFNDGQGNSNVLSAVSVSRCIYIAKYDTAGNFVWTHGIGGQSAVQTVTTNQGRGVHIDAQGYVFVIGNFQDMADFDPGPDTANMRSYSPSMRSIFILKLDASGSYVWSKAFGSTQQGSPAEGWRVVTDKKGNIYMTGFFQREAVFDPVGFASGNISNAIKAGSDGLSWFVSKLDSNGSYLWAKAFGRTTWPVQTDNGLGLQVDDRGDVYTSGYFSGKIYLDPDMNNSSRVLFQAGGANYSPEAFIVKLNTDGNYVWGRQFKSATAPGNTLAASIGRCIRLSPGNNLYAAGYFGGIVDFDPSGTAHKINSANAAMPDGYILKLSCNDTSSAVLMVNTCETSYEFLGKYYTESGDYQDRILNTVGCDSTIFLHLTLNPPEAVISVNEFELSTGLFKTYQWLYEEEIIPGANSQTYTVSKNGRYKVVVTSEDDCIDTSGVYIVTNVPPAGIDGIIRADEVKIYPNPTVDVLHIVSPVPLTMLLTGIEGKIIMKQEQAKQIRMRHLPAGLYLLKLFDEKGRLIKVEKVIRK